MTAAVLTHLGPYLRFGLTPIPLRTRSKEPPVKWNNGCNPTPQEFHRWFSNLSVNISVHCGENLAVMDCDYGEALHTITASRDLPTSCPVVKTGRGDHVWLKPSRPIRSQGLDGVGIKYFGIYMVALPSIHPSGVPYLFAVPVVRPFSSGVYVCRPELPCRKYITSFEVIR